MTTTTSQLQELLDRHTSPITSHDVLTVGAVLMLTHSGARVRITERRKDPAGLWYGDSLTLEPVDCLHPEEPGAREWTPYSLAVVHLTGDPEDRMYPDWRPPGGYRLMADKATAELPTAEYASRFGLYAPRVAWQPYRTEPRTVLYRPLDTPGAWMVRPVGVAVLEVERQAVITPADGEWRVLYGLSLDGGMPEHTATLPGRLDVDAAAHAAVALMTGADW